jgi:hypothetical protein
MARKTGIFIDRSVDEYSIDDEGLKSEQIREIIRDATATIVLCGPGTRGRKYVDWEIHATMYDSPINHCGGLLVINTPESSNCSLAAPEDERLIPNCAERCGKHSQEWMKNHLPDLPYRLSVNIMHGAPISVVGWQDICQDSGRLFKLIHNAFRRRNKFPIGRTCN